MHYISEKEMTTEEFEDNVTEEYDDDPATTIQSKIPISITLSPNSHMAECPQCECTFPTLSPYYQNPSVPTR